MDLTNEEREKLQAIYRKNGLPAGVEVRKFSFGTQPTTYLAVVTSTGLLYSSLARDEFGKVLSHKPKGGAAKAWDTYKHNALSSWRDKPTKK